MGDRTLRLSRDAALALLPEWPTQLLIGGKFVSSSDGRTFETVDPGTGKPLAAVAMAGDADVDAAIAEALRVWEARSWVGMSPGERSRVLWRVGELIEENAEELAAVEALDTGKPLRRARTIDVTQAAAHFFFHAGSPQRLSGRTIPVRWPGHSVQTVREPLGVVGAITPWNYPLLMACRKLAPALACGNSIVLKPAEETPLTALRLGELIYEAGLPEGTLSVLPGFGEDAGAAIARDVRIAGLSFIGGQDAASEVVRASASNFKRLSLELGGKAPFIIFANSDVDRAIASAIDGSMGNSGQDCGAAGRIFIEEPIYEECVDMLIARLPDVCMSDAFEDTAQVGPLISERHRESVEAHIHLAEREGAVVALGGQRPPGLLSEGYFLEPTLVSGATDSMAISSEEVFGPVVIPYEFRSAEEVIARANACSYGLAGGVWTHDIGLARRVSEQLRVGAVWVNCWERFDVAAPFGGTKSSGYGRDMGEEALEEFTDLKTIWLDAAS